MQVKKHYQTGFSLVSLMIASAISLFLIGGIITIYIDSRNAFNARTALSATTEKYRFAFQEMRRALIMAGRGIATSDDSPTAYQEGQPDSGARTFPGLTCNAQRSDCIVSGQPHSGATWTPPPEESSIVSLRYASAPAPCGVRDDTISGTMTVRFLVDAEGDLNCQVFDDGTLIQSQPIASDIAQMRVLYGLDTDPDPDGAANSYLTADQIEAHNWMSVVSIRIGLLVSSGVGFELPRAYRPDTPEQLDLLGAIYTAPDNQYIYKSVNTTISLRNLHHMDRQVDDS
jgi:type II secretory pathway pseudopilin PulG